MSNTVSKDVQLHSSLLSLPTETTLHIVGNLADHHLLSLAMVCKRLHYIALHHYFERHGVQDVRGRLKLAFGLHGYVPGIRTCLFLDSAREIEFVFRDSPYVLRDIDEAAHLLSRFTTLDSVKLNFKNLSVWQAGQSLCTTKGQNNLTVLASHMSTLLNAIHAKACTSFTVCGGDLKSYPYQEFRLAQQLPKALKKKLKAKARIKAPSKTNTPGATITAPLPVKNSRRPEVDWRVPGFDGPPLASLRAFNIESKVFLWHPFISWTLTTLDRSASSIVELSLCEIANIELGDLDLLFNGIYLPSLSKFTVSQHGLLFCHFRDFLLRHPRLAELCFRGEGDPLPVFWYDGQLSGLKRLCGPASCISIVLQHHQKFPFPLLVDIDISPLYIGNQEPKLMEMQQKALALRDEVFQANKSHSCPPLPTPAS